MDTTPASHRPSLYTGQPRYRPRLVNAEHRRRGVRPNPEERRCVKHLRRGRMSGWSGRRIALELNQLGVPSPSGKGP